MKQINKEKEMNEDFVINSKKREREREWKIQERKKKINKIIMNEIDK